MNQVLVYVVIIVNGYEQSAVVEVFHAKEAAISRAKKIAEEWTGDRRSYGTDNCTNENATLYGLEATGGRYVCVEGSPLQ